MLGKPRIDRIIPRQSCAILRVAGTAPWTPLLSPWVRGEVVGPRGGRGHLDGVKEERSTDENCRPVPLAMSTSFLVVIGLQRGSSSHA